MASLQPCRATLARTPRLVARALTPSARSYASSTETTTPESFKAAANVSSPKPASPEPRWSRTPTEMKASVQLDFAKHPHNKIWSVNNDPRKLDEMYDRLLGPNGKHLLPEELKWLAVTHKSFDQGRRGFNDRLALLGRMALIMETTKHIVTKDPIPGSRIADEFDRQPFEHPQLASLDNLTMEGPRDITGKDKLYELAVDVGLIDVVRWKPRLVRKLQASGVEVVLNGAIMAIIGAITLQHGSSVASKVIRERILAKVPQ
ncbi:ribonuclease-III-like-domain-containing protein [Thelonectria olida]|uniref:Ribonuclease-III-like-domain-containing protein n=1 Tax=Thelonectria olida TaxID=1576542 RepID=A0A9P8W9H1_9HYPO|nr:ribonuclease-III-like-domain-containing protein [Thelonectria olida]